MNFDELENTRQKYADKLRIGIFLIIGLFVTLVIGGLLFGSLAIVIFSLGLIFTIIYFIRINKFGVEYKKQYKAYFVEKNLKNLFTDLKYDHNLGMPREVLSATKMIRTGDIYSSNDFASGKYKDVGFTQADVHIQEEHTDSDGDTSYTTVFKGRWMVFEFQRKFTFRMQVVQKWFMANLKPKVGANGRKIERIQVESQEFNKRFKIFAEDGFEAFYILDPAFLDNILKLEDIERTKSLLRIKGRIHDIFAQRLSRKEFNYV